MFVQRIEKGTAETKKKEKKSNEALSQKQNWPGAIPDRRGASYHDDLARQHPRSGCQMDPGAPSRQMAKDTAHVIQRQVIVHKENADGNDNALSFMKDTAQKIDAILQNAFQTFLENRFPGASTNHVLLYLTRRDEFDKGNSLIHPSVSAGYVIESMVNAQIRLMEGVHLQVTGLLKGSRPDIVLKYDDLLGALDITASNNVGHIFNKSGNWTAHENIIYVAELTYPSIDFREMGPVDLTPQQKEDLQERIDRKQQDEKKWKTYLQEHFASNRDSLLSALSIQEISLRSATQRQKGIVIKNLRPFGIKAWEEKGVLKCSAAADFPLPENYVPSSWDQKARALILWIAADSLVWMRSLW